MEKIQFITHQNDKYSYADSAEIALRGGCRWIQLRMKDADDAVFIETALKVMTLCKNYDATLIFDDRVELTKELKAQGVHLGKQDMPINEARSILGEDFIIGGTANTYDDVVTHYHNGANYVGCGPYRFTTTKKNLSPILGLQGYEDIISQMQANAINIPLIAIGGIVRDDISGIIKTGVSGIALSGAVLQADNPVAEMKRIIESL